MLEEEEVMLEGSNVVVHENEGETLGVAVDTIMLAEGLDDATFMILLSTELDTVMLGDILEVMLGIMLEVMLRVKVMNGTEESKGLPNIVEITESTSVLFSMLVTTVFDTCTLVSITLGRLTVVAIETVDIGTVDIGTVDTSTLCD